VNALVLDELKGIVITGGNDGALCFWHAEKGELLGRLKVTEDYYLWISNPSSDSEQVYFATNLKPPHAGIKIGQFEQFSKSGKSNKLIKRLDFKDPQRLAWLKRHHYPSIVLVRINTRLNMTSK